MILFVNVNVDTDTDTLSEKKKKKLYGGRKEGRVVVVCLMVLLQMNKV